MYSKCADIVYTVGLQVCVLLRQSVILAADNCDMNMKMRLTGVIVYRGAAYLLPVGQRRVCAEGGSVARFFGRLVTVSDVT